MVSLSFPVIRLDEGHNQASGGSSDYQVPAALGLIVDATDYQIPVPPQLAGLEPNALHVIVSSDEVYRTDWDGRGRLKLSASNLRRVRGMGEFPGFLPGNQYVVGIGQERPGDHAEQLRFSVMWAGILKVVDA